MPWETVWENPNVIPFDEARIELSLTDADIDDAEARLARFAPFIMTAFPETADRGGIIESPLTEIPRMRESLRRDYGCEIPGRLLLKRDSDLAVAGSVKARGGIYEVLKHSEELALGAGLLHTGDSYEVFASERFREFFGKYAIHVGSTGNLGMSIGIMGAALGYRATVHMSADARQWKKDLLRSRGVTVIEYASDYSRAVLEGRRLAEQDPYSYFVDDENSTALFLGYAVAARRLALQLKEQSIVVDEEHPLIVTIPCGVGGAPGGITFGLKHTFGDNVVCIFAEPVQAPCMLLGMATGLHNGICVQDIGLTGLTAADGLAVGRPSKFVGKTVEKLVAAIVTIRDGALYDHMRALLDSEGIFIEPSACAAFQGVLKSGDMTRLGLTDSQLENASHIVWATGGSMVPPAEREKYIANRSLQEARL
ncbi:MAG: D-serine ammonia-lyase [Oscillospiraceae bacterium]|nr:D-serine ammonia-lyase [Oscillospiraceae bacterium]